jgi:hypothetical protein
VKIKGHNLFWHILPISPVNYQITGFVISINLLYKFLSFIAENMQFSPKRRGYFYPLDARSTCISRAFWQCSTEALLPSIGCPQKTSIDENGKGKLNFLGHVKLTAG